MILCWAVPKAAADRVLTAALSYFVPMIRTVPVLDVDDKRAPLMMAMSARIIGRRVAGERDKMRSHGRPYTKPGSLLKSQIPSRTWGGWDDAVQGFVKTDLVSHERYSPAGQFGSTLTVTDIATGWTANRSVQNKAQKSGSGPCRTSKTSSRSRTSTAAVSSSTTSFTTIA